MSYRLGIEFKGLCCFVRRRDAEDKLVAVDVLMPNATDPTKLRVPSGQFAKGSITAHWPKIEIAGAQGGPSTLDAYGCEVTLDLQDDPPPLDDRDLGLLRLDLLAHDSGAAADRALTHGLLSGDFEPKAHPLLGARVHLDFGKLVTEYRGEDQDDPELYRMAWLSGPPQLVPLRVHTELTLANPFRIVLTARSSVSGDPGTWTYTAPPDSEVRVTIKNLAVDVDGARDFLAHYHLLARPSLLRRLPFPIDRGSPSQEPGRGDDAQCSPVEHP